MLKEFQDIINKNDPHEDSYKGDLLSLLSLQSLIGALSRTVLLKSNSELSFEQAQKVRFEDLAELLEAVTRYSLRMGFDLDSLMKYTIKVHTK